MRKLAHFYSVILVLLLFLILRCSNVENWSDSTDHISPGTVSDPVVENLHGGARITYTLPFDNDLLGVKAIYSFTSNGKILEAFSSAFRDTIELKGFPDTSERIVKLICIDKSKNESEPVEVLIQPKTLPVDLVQQSLKVKSAFGGVYVSWNNEFKEDIGIELHAADSTGEMLLDYTFYSNTKEGKYTFRGFDNTERKFQIQVVDRWNNNAESLDTVLKPLLEVEIPSRDILNKAIWERFGYTDKSNKWRGDILTEQSKYRFDYILDSKPSNCWETDANNYLGYYTGREEDQDIVVGPCYVVIDLGAEYFISRHKFWDRKATLRDRCAKDYEIWGTVTLPKGGSDYFGDIMESLAYWTEWPEIGGTDQWKYEGGWVKLGLFETVGPISGATRVEDITTADRDYAFSNGLEWEWDMESTSVPVRYLRIVFINNWIGSKAVDLCGFQLWGSAVE